MKLTKEQKEAIEELSKKAVICNYEERDYPNMICFKKDMIIALNLIEKLQKENEELNKENEHLHREINRRIKLKIENEKIVDTQFIYKQKIEDKIEEILSETEITDFNSLVEAFLEIKKLLESE